MNQEFGNYGRKQFKYYAAMKILEIYKKYQIMPNLAEHQLAVAGVAEMICGHVDVKVNKHDIVAACLLHDIGNIIKFDLTVTQKLYPEITDDQLGAWRAIQSEFVKKYGANEHEAAIAIAKELGVGEKVIELIDCIGFNTGTANAASPDFARKICAYSDMRVGPRGIVSLEERLADLRVRYGQKFHQMGSNERQRQNFENGLREIERQIFIHCDITPNAITESVIGETKGKLKEYQI